MDIINYKAIHNNDEVWIMACGPSVLSYEPERFKESWIITVNDSIGRFPWAPYSCIMDVEPLEKWKDKCNLLFTSRQRPLKWTKSVNTRVIGEQGFSKDLRNGIYSGASTAFFALQLANWMGFKTINLLGIDFTESNGLNHFFGNVETFKRGTEYYFPRMMAAFELAAKELEKTPIQIYNYSSISKLKCFPYKELNG